MNAKDAEEAEASEEPSETRQEHLVELGRQALATLLHGVGTGVIGIFIAELIRQVQIFAYGNSENGFLEIAMEAQPWRRMICVTLGGIFGALAWYWLRGVEPAFVPVEVCMEGEWMPPGVTLINGMIQDIVVALGGSFGREAAPREIAAMWGCVLAEGLGVKEDFRKKLIACGTGAGLAAVYSVPISGVLYTVEHVLAWDVSLQALVPAIITSCLATWVASAVVDPNGLYAMEKVSNRWPSIGLIAWSAFIGPLCAFSALAFRRLVKFAESMKPQARLTVSFRDAKEGQQVRISSFDVQGERYQGTIVEKQNHTVRVSFEKSSMEETYNHVGWQLAQPEGRRDWKILIAMPAVFLVLGILSHDFPSLLGNGRALAEVAIGRERTCGFFIMLLFLKAMVTAASIGAGAAGGTLTPSVALGATIGAIVGETMQFAFPDWVPQEDATMSVISAAAFLGVAMRSPVTSLWLLIEFSAQGVDRGDLLAALRGDFGPLMNSKLAVGMLIPVGIGVASAHLTVHATNKLHAALHRPTLPPIATRVRSSSMDLDLGLRMEETDTDEFSLDENGKDICYTTFGLGLVFNTCLTVCVAAAAPPCHATVTKVSAWGVPLAGLAALVTWFYNTWRRRRGQFEPLISSTDMESEAGYAKLEKARQVHVEVEGGDIPSRESSARSVKNNPVNETPSLTGGTTQCQTVCTSLAIAVLVGLGGALVPLAPWVLHVWHDVGGGLTALAVSLICALTAAACSAAMNSLRSAAAPVAAVGREVVSIATAAAAACGVGIVWRLLSDKMPEGLSISC